MKAVVQYQPGISEVIQATADVPIPVPTKGQVLIKVDASPIHPADLLLLQGRYPVSREYPLIPGREGSGRVVKSGGGLKGWRLTNKRVAFFLAEAQLQGSWAEYVVCPTAYCVMIGDLPTVKASCLMMNPLTVLMFNEVIKTHKARAIIHTAGASTVGLILLKWCHANNILCINIVSKPKHEAILSTLAAENVLNSSSSTFEEDLKRVIALYEPKVCFDAVGGALAAKLLGAMPPQSTLYSYGKLSGQNITEIDPRWLMDDEKVLTGLWMPQWLMRLGKLKRASAYKTLLKNSHMFCCDVQGEFSLDNFQQALDNSKLSLSQGKIIFKPSQADHIPTEENQDSPVEDHKTTDLPKNEPSSSSSDDPIDNAPKFGVGVGSSPMAKMSPKFDFEVKAPKVVKEEVASVAVVKAPKVEIKPPVPRAKAGDELQSPSVVVASEGEFQRAVMLGSPEYQDEEEEGSSSSFEDSDSEVKVRDSLEDQAFKVHKAGEPSDLSELKEDDLDS
jgi:NADPH:quinone reductase-like Zn-dependent oxidoreductase